MASSLEGDPIDPNEPVLDMAPTFGIWEAPPAPFAPFAGRYPPPGYGYPPPGYGQPTPEFGFAPRPGQYPAQPNIDTEHRPGEAVTAAVLSFVSAGLLLVGGFVVIFAASSLQFDYGDEGSSDRTTMFVFAGLANIVVAAMFIAGAVLMLGRARGSRVGIDGGALLSIALGIFWLAVQQDGASNVVFWLFLFCGPSIAAGVFALTGRVTTWLNSAAPY